MSDGPESLERIAPVSRETRDRLDVYVATLRQWQRAKNLVSPATLDHLWWRHVADSLQLIRLAPLRGMWADLGSGAGFPGLVVAIAMRDAGLAPEGSGHVHLIEANQRKAAFLREAARLTGAPVTVHDRRHNEVLPTLGTIDVITARALAPLDELLRAAQPYVDKGAVALFPKGQDVGSELTLATRCWSINFDQITSLTEPTATVLRIWAIRSAQKAGTEP